MITPSILQEEAVILALLRLADLLLDRYEGTQKLDEELLKSGNVTGRRRLAMLVRVGERRLIRHFKEAVIRMLAADDEEGVPLQLMTPTLLKGQVALSLQLVCSTIREGQWKFVPLAGARYNI
jgi:hypothetical protein